MVDRPASRVFRFAPSPNGFLHLGHAYSALLNAQMAQDAGGRFLVRIEDIDVARCRPEYEQAIYEDLAWLGLCWEQPVRRQSDHVADYVAALDTLRSKGLLYPCFCSRGDIARTVAGRVGWPRDPDGALLYPGTCRARDATARAARFAAGERPAWRLDQARALGCVADPLTWTECGGATIREVAANPGEWGDVLLGRRDIGTSYHISVVLDDAAQGVSDVVRGQDLFASTSVHRLLQALLGLPVPRYRHHPLITDASGQKLSKSRGSPSLRELRGQGMTATQIISEFGMD